MNQDIICVKAIDEETLSTAVTEFLRSIRPERQRLFDYYHGQQPIPKGEAVRGRPNNLLHAPFPRYITEVHTAYFLGIAPTVAFGDQNVGEVYSKLKRELGLDHLLFDIGRDMSICGAGFALVWLERSGLKACRCNPCTCFAIRGGTAGAPLLGTVRLFQTERSTTGGVLYTAETLQPFTWDGQRVVFGVPEENLLRTIPLLPFANNCQGCGDFEMVTGLVDAYNLLLSGAMDDMQSVANAFLALYGLQSTTQSDIEEANRTRVLSLGEGGRAEFVTKNLNHEALGQLEQNLRRSILQMSMTPDLADEHFSGQSSGVAMQYKLWGIEQARAAKERSFTDGVRRLFSALTAGLQVLGSPADFTSGEITFYKNLPQNHTELAQTLLSLSPLLSQRTILEQLPWVANAEEELRRKAAETGNQQA